MLNKAKMVLQINALLKKIGPTKKRFLEGKVVLHRIN